MSKGLSDLLNLSQSTSGPEEVAKRELIELNIADLRPNEFQPRREFEATELQGLADSISELGVLQPVLVRTDGDGFSLIAGERRWRAAKLAGLETIPAIVGDFADLAALEQAIVENLHRSNLNPLEEAKAYERLVDDFDLSHVEIAKRMGKSRPAVVNTLRLLSLPTKVLDYLTDGSITAGHGRALLSVEDRAEQLRLARVVVRDGLSVRETERLAKETHKPAARAKPAKEVDYGHLEVIDRLSEYLETTVRIDSASKRSTGRIVIDYADTMDLARIFELVIPRGHPN